MRAKTGMGWDDINMDDDRRKDDDDDYEDRCSVYVVKLKAP